MLLNILGSKAFFSNGKTFYTAQFLLLGLYTPESGTRFLRAQFVLVYLGCGLSKALDPDWWSGQYFENWFARRVEHGPYMAAAALLPPLLLSKVMSWSVIAMEFAVAGLFCRPRWDRAGIWLTLFLHTGILVLLWGATFAEFYYGVAAALLAFTAWPKAPLVLAYDAGSRAMTRLAGAVRALDLDGLWRVEAGAPGAPLRADLDGRRYEGVAALKLALRLTPLLAYLLLMALHPYKKARPFLIVPIALFFFPPLEALWDRLLRRGAGGVVLYDGVCGLCDRFVQFTLARDPQGLFRFAALQKPYAAELLARHGVDHADLDTVYLVVDAGRPTERLLSRSRAVFAVLAGLGAGWRLLSCAGALPASLLDRGYDLVASLRYRLFGRYDACVLPTAEQRSRFLD